jgi:DNA-binding IclR family transcriptional regulator
VYGVAVDTPTGTQAVERAMAILELFDERTPDLSIADVVSALDVHRSTASRMMATLERHGLLEQTDVPGRYRLGLGLVTLAGLVLNRFPVRALARPRLRELRDQTNETAWLGMLDGQTVIYLDQASNRHVTVNVDWVGRRQALTDGVTGRLLLAFQPADVIERLVDDAAPGAVGLSDVELASVRRRGHAVCVGDADDAYTGVAVPIRDHRGAVVAAIALGGPRYRVSPERLESELVPMALRAAARVSEALGHVAA